MSAKCSVSECNLYKIRGEYCAKHFTLNNIKNPTTQTEKYSWHKLYYSVKWRKLRERQLVENPLCIECGNVGLDVDHIIDHKGNIDLFYDLNNLQTLCKACHSRKTMTTNNSRRYKSTYETVKIVIGNKSDIESYRESMGIAGNERYVLQLIVKGSNDLIFHAKTKLEAEKIKDAFITNNRVLPIFKIIQEV